MFNPNPNGTNRYKAWELGYIIAKKHILSEEERMKRWMGGHDMTTLNASVIDPDKLENYRVVLNDRMLFKEFKRGLKAYQKCMEAA